MASRPSSKLRNLDKATASCAQIAALCRFSQFLHVPVRALAAATPGRFENRRGWEIRFAASTRSVERPAKDGVRKTAAGRSIDAGFGRFA